MLTFTLATVLLTGLVLAVLSAPAASIMQCAHLSMADTKGCTTAQRSGDPTCEEEDLGATHYEVDTRVGPAKVNLLRATACDNRTGDAWRQSILEAHAGAGGAGADLAWSGVEDDEDESSRVTLTAGTDDDGAAFTWRYQEERTSYDRTCRVEASAHEDLIGFSHKERAPCWALGPPVPPGAPPLLLP